MRIDVLGQIEVVGDRPVPVGGPTQRRLLGVLALHHDEVVSVDRLIDVTWPNGDRPSRAERNIHTYISRLRSSMDGVGERIETVGAGYRLHLDADELDLERFDRLAAAAGRHVAAGDEVAALDAIDEALTAWRGDPFGEFAGEPWAMAAVTRARETQASLRETRAELLLALGRPAEVIADMEALGREQPYREAPRALLMQALYHAGRHAEALRAFQSFRRELIDEVGVEPSQDLVELDRHIATGSLVAPTGTPSRTVGSYVLGERIGEGAFAVVYRATQPTLEREVAVKVVRAELANQPEFVRRFEAEAQMVARIEHPYVVPLYDYWREPDRAYLVMRLMTGGTLEERLDGGPVPVDDALEIVANVADALTAAHGIGVVHRDVKPENIMFDAEGRAFLADFGIALDAAERATPEAALSEGSPLFASPEQLRREPVGPEADVHALGVVAYTMLVGHAPFADAPDDATLLRRQLTEPIPSVRRVRPELPEAVDRVLATATAKSPADRYPTAESFALALATAVEHGDAATGATVVRPRANPYKGLRAFAETDAADFRGRDRLIDELLGELAKPDERFLAVIGPSGSGKSSVVRAGLLPALRADRVPGAHQWFVTSMTPGTHPLEALETALLRVAVNPPGSLLEQLGQDHRGILRGVRRVLPDDDTALLLVIDQFEELFTNDLDPLSVDHFLEALVVATAEPGSPLRVVITLRADFFDRPLRHPSLAPVLKRRTVAVAPLAPDELEHAIVDPAASVGVDFEPGVVARIVADVGGQPGSLPLLQYALTRAFEHADGDTITEGDYDAVGGLTGSLAQRAEELWSAAGADEQPAIRRLFERLVQLGDGVADTRRRVSRSELAPDTATDAALERYGAARLLTFDRHPVTREPTVEVAHEALIQQWPRLRGWLDGDRDALRAHRHLTAAAASWIDRGRDPSDLYRGARLEAAAQLVGAGRLDPNADEAAFLAASTAQRDAEADVEHRKAVRLRRLATAAGLLAVVALVASLIALIQRNRAEDRGDLAEQREQLAIDEAARADAESAAAQQEAERADAESRTARVRELAASSRSVRAQDPELAVLLALAAGDAGEGTVLPEAEQALHDAVLSMRLVARLPSGNEGVADFFPAGDAFLMLDPLVGEDDTLSIWGLDPVELRQTLRAPGLVVADAAISPDGTRVVAGDYRGRAWVWDATSGELERELVLDGSGADGLVTGLVPVFSSGGGEIAMSWLRPTPDGDEAGGVTLWDVTSGNELRTIDAPDGMRALNVEFSPDDRLLAVSVVDGPPGSEPGVRLWDVGSGELVRVFRGHDAQVRDMGFTPDGQRLVTGSYDSTVKVFDVATGNVLGSYEGHEGRVGDVEVSDDGRLVASAGSEVHVWELDTLVPLDVEIHHADVDGLAFSPDGSTLVTSSGFAGSTRAWDLSPTARREGPAVPGPQGFSGDEPPGGVAVSPDGDRFAANRGEGRIGVWDLSSGQELTSLTGPGPWISDVAYSPDGSLLAAAGEDGLTIWSTDGFEVLDDVAVGRRVDDVEFRPDGAALLVAGVDGIAEYELGPEGVSDRPTVVHTEVPATIATYRPGDIDVLRAGESPRPDGFSVPYIELGERDDGRWVENLGDSGGEGPEVFDTMWPRASAGRFTPDGDLLLLAGGSGAVVLDGTAGFGVLTDQDDHGGQVWDAELSPDGADAATVGVDAQIRIWDPLTGITRLVLPSDGATDLTYSPDGRYLVATGPNGATRVYLMDVDDLVGAARDRLTRTWTAGECAQYRLDESCPAASTSDDRGPDVPGTATGEDETSTNDGDESGTDGADEKVATQQVDEATAIGLGEAVVAAMDAHDADALRDLIAATATFDVHYADWGNDVEFVTDWLSASDWRFDLHRCRQLRTGNVRCTVDQRNAWSEAVDVPTAPATVAVDVAPDGIEAVRLEADLEDWVVPVVFAFLDFVDAADPGATEMMVEGEGLFRPLPTPEAVELFERHTAEFTAAMSS